jgi:hypothetical protein
MSTEEQDPPKTGKILDFNEARRQGEIAKTGVDVDDIRERLHASPKAFVEWLYGGRAYFTRHDARIGNVTGEAGNSLSIDLRSGLWKDHASDEGGDLISLYRAWAGYGGEEHFVLSLKEIAQDYLGDQVEAFARPTWTQAPKERIQKQQAQFGTAPRAENVELGAPSGDYKYYDLHGKIIASVMRFDLPNGEKTYRPWCFKNVDGREKWVMGAPNIRPLYNLPEVAVSPTVVLVEGEKCADTLRTLGIAATSSMQGAKAPVDKTDWTPLAGKKVVIWPDNDQPGFDYAKSVAGKLQSLGCTVLGVAPPAGMASGWDVADCVLEGGDALALIAAAQPITGTVTASKIRMRTLADLRHMSAPKWLIDGIITENGLSMIWGPSGAMKSFVGLDICLCIAYGLAWHGRALQKGFCVYVAAEGAYGMAKRIIGWQSSRARGLADPPFGLVDHPVALAQDVEALIARILAEPERPSLIILDTVARTFGAGDENKQVDMNAYVAAVDRLRTATGAHIMVIHHSGVSETSRERGSNVLRAAADTVIKVERSRSKLTLVNASPGGKQKDAEEFPSIVLEARKVAFISPDGEEENTIILNDWDSESVLRNGPEEDSSEDGNKKRQKRGAVQMQLLDALIAANGLAMNRQTLVARSGIKNGSFPRAIDALVADGTVEQTRDITENACVWRMAGT